MFERISFEDIIITDVAIAVAKNAIIDVSFVDCASPANNPVSIAHFTDGRFKYFQTDSANIKIEVAKMISCTKYPA